MEDLAGDLAQFAADGNECVEIRLVTCPEDLKDYHEPSKKQNGQTNATDAGEKEEIATGPAIPSFSPIMCYQTFGDNEKLFGYSDLEVRLYYSAGRLNIYNGLKYSKMIDKKAHKGIEPDPVLKMIADDYETEIEYNIDEFSKSLSSERSFIPPGEAYNEFYIDIRPKQPNSNSAPTERKFFQIFSADFETPGFISYLSKMQTFLKWYIEAASYLDVEDNRCEFFMIFHKLPIGAQKEVVSSPTEFQYVFVGYCSVVRFYYYPEQVRPRISQFLILPPFQKQGLGTKLLENVNNYYNNSKVFDMTVESPEPEFQFIRDYIDCKRCQTLPEFSIVNLREGWNKRMAIQAREKFKIHAPQARRVYEILRLLNIKACDVFEQKAFNSSLHTRLDGAYQQQIQRLQKFKNRYSAEAFGKLMAEVHVPQEVREAEIEAQIVFIKQDYDKVVARLLKPEV